MAITERKKPIDWYFDYYGLSTDDKPTGVSIGCTFFETDTGILYETYDGTNWVAHAGDDEIAKIPKSDSDVTWNATAMASIRTEVAGAITDPIGVTYDPETREAALQEAGGVGIRNIGVSLGDGATAGTQTVNLFKIEGCIQIKDLLMIVSAVGDATTFGDVKFEVIADGAAVDLTTGVAGAATVVGSKFMKMAAKNVALVHMKADDVRVEESVFNKPFVEAIVNCKPSVDNYLRVSFTGDAATDITVTAYCRWVATCGNSTVTAA